MTSDQLCDDDENLKSHQDTKFWADPTNLPTFHVFFGGGGYRIAALADGDIASIHGRKSGVSPARYNMHHRPSLCVSVYLSCLLS